MLVLADEPTSGLAPKNANSVMSSLRSCAERGAAVLLVTHSAAVAEVCDQRYVLDGAKWLPSSIDTGFDVRNAGHTGRP